MKLLRTLVMGDFRSVAYLLTILLLLHLLRFGSFLGWFGTPAQDLVGNELVNLPILLVVSFVRILLLSLIVVLSLTSPFSARAKEAFLSTRPVSLRLRVIARVTTLFLVYWLPIVIADFLILLSTNQLTPAGWLALGYTALWYGVWLAAIIPAIWVWRGRNETILGLVALAAGFMLVSFLLVQVDFGLSLRHIDSAFTRPRILAAAAMGGLLFWAFLGWIGRRGFGSVYRRFLVTAGITGLSALVLYLYPMNQIEATQNVAIEASSVRLFDNGRLEVRYPAMDKWQNWDAHELKLHGKLVTFSNHFSRSNRDSIGTPLAGQLREDFGSNYTATMPVAEPDSSNTSNVSVRYIELREGEEVQVALRAQGYSMAWEQVAELPMKKGARDGNWTFVADSRDIQETSNPWSLSLDQRLVRPLMPDILWPYRFFLVNDEAQIVQAATYGYPSGECSGSTLSWIGYSVRFNNAENLKPRGSKERLLIYRLKRTPSLASDWSGKVTVEPWLESHEAFVPRTREMDADDVSKWLLENATPSVDDSDYAIKKYFIALFGELNQLNGHLPINHEVIIWLTELVKTREEGIELLLQVRKALAANDHYAKCAIDTALARGFSREDLPRLVDIVKVLEKAATRGWLDDVAKALVERARNGEHNALRMIMKTNDHSGLSNDELFDLFMAQPSSDNYRLLDQNDEIRVRMDRQINEWLNTLIPSIEKTSGQPGFPMELALAAGFPDAPKRLQRLYQSGDYEPEGASIGLLLDKYFKTSGWPKGKKIEYFMEIHPERFEFDPGAKKYHQKGVEQ